MSGNEMIERVAKAMHQSHGILLPYDLLSERQKEPLLIHAKAAITAMREPTEKMIFAPDRSGNKEIWQAMIDAALN